jgi:hypothetical protein
VCVLSSNYMKAQLKTNIRIFFPTIQCTMSDSHYWKLQMSFDSKFWQWRVSLVQVNFDNGEI